MAKKHMIETVELPIQGDSIIMNDLNILLLTWLGWFIGVCSSVIFKTLCCWLHSSDIREFVHGGAP